MKNQSPTPDPQPVNPQPAARSPQSDDELWMQVALQEAALAAEEGEVPVGAVIIHAGRIIGRGHNRTEALQDPTAHAEILALSAASNYLHNWRLAGATIYVTIEPCLMCTGALVLARVKRIVFGAHDTKFGACGSIYDIPWDSRFNHKFETTPGVLARESTRLLQAFFRSRRRRPAAGHRSSIPASRGVPGH
jgi:tRNA(adenine34) deaminase